MYMYALCLCLNLSSDPNLALNYTNYIEHSYADYIHDKYLSRYVAIMSQ